jgi:amino-acid N-acetyltransferase
MAITVRHAKTSDVPALGKIINDCAEYGLMLHRSHSFLYEHVRDFHVACDGDAVIGVCGLSIVWANLTEVFALAVRPDYRRRGVGGRLVRACIDEARCLGIRRLMTLTYEDRFFTSLGFETVDRQQLPLKVWSECLRCSKNKACDEIAMSLVLTDVPDVSAPQPEAPPPGTYEVPVTLEFGRIARQKMDDPHE